MRSTIAFLSAEYRHSSLYNARHFLRRRAGAL